MVVSRSLDNKPPYEDPVDGLSLDVDQRRPTMALAGWQRFVESPAAQLELLPAGEALDGPVRASQRGIRRGPAQLPLRDEHRGDLRPPRGRSLIDLRGRHAQ